MFSWAISICILESVARQTVLCRIHLFLWPCSESLWHLAYRMPDLYYKCSGPHLTSTSRQRALELWSCVLCVSSYLMVPNTVSYSVLTLNEGMNFTFYSHKCTFILCTRRKHTLQWILGDFPVNVLLGRKEVVGLESSPQAQLFLLDCAHSNVIVRIKMYFEQSVMKTLRNGDKVSEISQLY